MKLLHTGDTQIKNWPSGGMNPETGLNRRFEDALKCFDFMVDYAIEHGVEYFIHAGDVNEERNPDSIAIVKFAERIKRLIDHNIKVIIVVGNHDIDSSIGTTTSVSYLKALGIKNLYIADNEVETFEFSGEDSNSMAIRFHCLPYFTKAQRGFSTNSQLEKYLIEKIDSFKRQKDADQFYNVAVSHYTVDKVFEGLEINETIIPVTEFKGFDYAAFGHIHKYEMYYDLGVMGGYVGSPYKVNFGENHDKFFNVVNFSTGDIDKVLIPNRDFEEIYIDAKDADHASIEEYVIQKLANMELAGKFLKITIGCYQSFNPRAIYEFLKGKELFHYLPIQFDRHKVKQEARLEFKQGMSSLQVVNSYLDKQKLNATFKKNVLELSNEIIQEAKI
jgi:exonuclease SbcD